MIFRKINMEEKEFETIFKIDVSKIVYSWDYYLNQYVKVLNLLIETGVNNGNLLKQQFIPFLFIFRHIIEISIKASLKEKGIPFEHVHNITELAKIIQDELPPDFLSDFEKLRLDGEGDCFRYIEKNDGNLHIDNHCEIDVLSLLNSYEKWSKIKGSINVKPIIKIELKKKTDEHNFIFYTQDCQHLGVMRTQYDECVSTLLTAIAERKLSVDDILMPLLFLIRHSIELGIKDNLNVIIDPSNKLKIVTHKLRKLYNLYYGGYLQDCIQKMPQSEECFKKETIDFLDNIEKLSDLISLLDNKSLNFRFPVDKIPFKEDTLIKTYRLYCLTDTFLNVGSRVLVMYGFLLPVNVDYELDL